MSGRGYDRETSGLGWGPHAGQQSAPHPHVLVCIWSNVRQFSTSFHSATSGPWYVQTPNCHLSIWHFSGPLTKPRPAAAPAAGRDGIAGVRFATFVEVLGLAANDKGIRAEEGVEEREGGEGGRSVGFGFGFGFRFGRKPITVGDAVGWDLCPTQVPGLSSLCSAALWSGRAPVPRAVPMPSACSFAQASTPAPSASPAKAMGRATLTAKLPCASASTMRPATGQAPTVRCSRCSAGWRGASCQSRCYSGVTVGQSCVCHSRFAGANCSLRCPGQGNCTGHGICNDGAAGDGSCSCDEGWCVVHCVLQ